MAQFFIHRPVFAWVLAIVTMLIGTWSLIGLPVSQYPDIAPTTIRITANYSGATRGRCRTRSPRRSRMR